MVLTSVDGKNGFPSRSMLDFLPFINVPFVLRLACVVVLITKPLSDETDMLKYR